MAVFNVAEKFISINGEGTRAGQLSVFIRLYGCNLACSFCDTNWARTFQKEGEYLTEQQIYDYIVQSRINKVTLTGGEPLLTEQVDVLLKKLIEEEQLTIEIETNGSVLLAPFYQISNRILFTMDYKLPFSKMESSMKIENFEYLKKEDTIKFVIGDKKDLVRAKELIEQYQLSERCHVYFSPVYGTIPLTDIVDFMKEYTMNDVIMQIQMHKIIWSPDTCGV